jgi:predicted DCC family thiol-disulfide oxidoreductase YuxK
MVKPAASNAEDSAGAAAAPLTEPSLTEPPLTVLYDGSCPLCRREMALYRRQAGDAPLCFTDISDPAVETPAGVPRERLMARFHVRQADGSLLDGAEAFLALWSRLPGWRWLARLGRWRGVARWMERAYSLFLKGRPALQRLARRLEPMPPTR